MSQPAVLQSSELQAKLRILSGPQKGRSFRLISDCVSIGRVNAENDIILDDPYCSRKHAVIIKNAHTFVLQRISKQAHLKVGKKDIKKSKELQHKDILIIGQTQIKFEILKDIHPLQNPTFLPVQNNHPSSPQISPLPQSSLKSNPWLIRFIFISIFGALLYIGLTDSPSDTQQKTAIQLRTQKDIESDIKAVEQMESERVKEKNIMKDRSHKNAHIAYLRGIRDYRQGLFGRARENFRVCKTLYPKHKLCTGYLKKSQIKYEQLAQRNMILGKQYRDQNQFRQCAFSFKTVMIMMSYNKSHPLYSEAKTNFTFCNTQMEEIY